MKILYDHQIFSYQERIGGVTRYFYEIMKRLPLENWETSVKYSNNPLFKELAEAKSYDYKYFFPNINLPRKGRLMLELGKPYSRKIIKKNDYDILHLTHYESYAINDTSKPIVITYHDKLFSSYAYNKRTESEQRKCLEKAAAVVCISENTKKDFLSVFDYPEDKIHVIYHGINTLPVGKKLDKKEKYILFVGGRASYKNFDNLARAFSILSKKDPDLYLYCTGKAFSENELELLEQLGIGDKTKAKYVSDFELADLYANAECFVFPSKYEGFGMPLLEAMNQNCPVCCSNAHCFPEIVNDAALLFNPDKPEDIANKINQIINNESLREELIEKGNERKNYFSWEKSVKQHIELYESLIQ